MATTFAGDDNDIDIKELILSFWSNKVIILITIILSVGVSGYYVLNTQKRYTAKALFSVEDPFKANELSISNQLSKIAGFSSVSNNDSTNSVAIVEQIKTKMFIESIDKSVNLFSDPEFNSYNPNHVDPTWKSELKKLIGYNSDKRDHDEMAWQSIVKTFNDNVQIEITDAGFLSLSVTHKEPYRAAYIANEIMLFLIKNNKDKINQKQDNQLNYLSTKLGDALYDLEKSQSRLKEFTIKYSALPIEAFTSESLKLDALKVQLENTRNIYYAAKSLSNILVSGEKNRKSYLLLKKDHPIVDQVEFRRIFGQNEIIREWSWPKKENTFALIETLADRKKRLEISVNESQIKAKKLAINVENYAALERKTTISKATYSVLMEQVKSNSLQAGFRPDQSEIYEYAASPIIPSSPNRKMVFTLGSIIGLIIGLGISLIISIKRNTFYTISSFVKRENKSVIKINTLYKRRKKDLKTLEKINNFSHEPILQDIIIDINNSKNKLINISNLRSKISARDLARIIGVNLQGKNLKVAHVDISLNLNTSNKEFKTYKDSKFLVIDQINTFKCLKIQSVNHTKDYISDKSTIKEILALTEDFDIVIISSEIKDFKNLVNALKNEEIFHISMVRRGKTKREELNMVLNILPLGSILYA